MICIVIYNKLINTKTASLPAGFKMGNKSTTGNERFKTGDGRTVHSRNKNYKVTKNTFPPNGNTVSEHFTNDPLMCLKPISEVSLRFTDD